MSNLVRATIITKILTNDAITITGEHGITKVNIKCTSTTGGSVLGSRLDPFINGASVAIPISQNSIWEQEAPLGMVIDGLTITAPAGCTFEITMF